MNTFENIVDWLGIKGIFVDENYEVYDLEKTMVVLLHSIVIYIIMSGANNTTII